MSFECLVLKTGSIFEVGSRTQDYGLGTADYGLRERSTLYTLPLNPYPERRSNRDEGDEGDNGKNKDQILSFKTRSTVRATKPATIPFTKNEEDCSRNPEMILSPVSPSSLLKCLSRLCFSSVPARKRVHPWQKKKDSSPGPK